MKKTYLIIIFLIVSNCTLNKVIKHHGVNFLENKQKKLELLISNRNDITSLLGPASVKSSFDNDVWIYIERKTTASEIKTLGRKKLLTNSVLILEIDNKGLLVKKDFLDLNDMNKLKISKSETNVINNKNTFISSVLTSLRHKINDPLGKRKAK
ncbi:outer membrane protein assembly factor BamE [Candidatus Pelagibacter sp.]|jgi:outer membrane protein assembly factor BamE (lipoprotein component of BamABCDE complex)|nr:outer membrane protein assembly factor BamE [Candidatus Pelagibacter sp.]